MARVPDQPDGLLPDAHDKAPVGGVEVWKDVNDRWGFCCCLPDPEVLRLTVVNALMLFKAGEGSPVVFNLRAGTICNPPMVKPA